ncbi:Uncharacterized protein PHSC3_000006 [Chlamydiales bacterium STE3]|nr:Uncharacterized protein PHSC3_000006 [Chlamydiales bacterium STE3]
MRRKFCIKKFIFLLFCSFSQLVGDFNEPKYKVVKAEENIEIRSYPHLLVAEVKFNGKRKEALKEGFKVLADYISGNNFLKQKIEMTAPVLEQSLTTLSIHESPIKQLNGNEWLIRYIFPESYNLENAPKPHNASIQVLLLPAKHLAVIRYSGRTGDENVTTQMTKLQKFICDKQLKPIGPPIFAYYNPPWTLPFMRRNEMMIFLEE